MPKREIDLKVTLDDADNETLELVCMLMKRTPDELLGELLGNSLATHLKSVLGDFREAAKEVPSHLRKEALAVAERLFSSGRTSG